MAIINASDLLVYKKSPANVAQVTKIFCIDASPYEIIGTGTLNILKSTDETGTETPSIITGGNTFNNATNLLARVRTVLETEGYTVSITSNVDTEGFRFITVTNGLAGDVSTLDIVSSGGTLNDGAIVIAVITSGETNNEYEPIAHSTSASVSFNMDLRDITTKDSGGFQDNAGGLRSFELSTDALQDVNADLEFKEFFDDINSRSEITVRFSERDTGVKWEGLGLVTSVSMDAGVEDNTTYSVSITGTGIADQGTY